MTSTTSPPRRRNPVLVALDIIASVLLLIFGAAIAVTVITYALSYAGIQAQCTPALVDGLVCNSVVLNIVVFGLIIVAVVALFLGFGFFIVSLIRRRYSFWWPLGAIIVTLGFFYLGSWIAGMTVPAA